MPATGFRVEITKGTYKGKKGIIDTCGYIKLIDNPSIIIHQTKCKYRFIDFNNEK